jgi:type I restriction enzyme, S subunit
VIPHNKHRKREQRRLKYAATINDESLSEATEPDFQLQYIDIGNVDSSGTIHEVVTHSFEGAPSRARRLVRDGDVIVSTVRTYLQAIAPIIDPPDGLVVSTGFAVIRPRREVLAPGFCKYVLRESRFLYEVEARSVGVSYPAINASDLGEIRIDVPPIDEQRRIAKYLDAQTAEIDALVADKEQMLALLEEKRAALVTLAVTRGLDPKVALKPSGLEWLGDVPKHWAVERLKFHLLRLEQGWSPQCDNFPAEGDEWGVLKVGAVNSWEFNPSENKRLPGTLEPLLEYRIAPRDVLMSRANTTQLLGSVVFVRNVSSNLLLCDKLYRLDISETRLDREYAVAFLRSGPGRFRFEQEATGASNSMQNIGQDTVRNTWLLIPPLEEQRDIAAYLTAERESSDKLENDLRESIALLKERRSALITAAVTGQVPVEEMVV